MIEIINNFRSYHGKRPVWGWNNVISDYCFQHCLEMAKRGDIYHAEPCYLNGWAEAVGVMSYNGDWHEAKRRMIFDNFGMSGHHRDILLNRDNMAFGIVVNNYKMYVCVRAQ